LNGLGRILVSERPHGETVAWRWDASAGRDRPVSWAELRGHVARLRARLSACAAGPWLLEANDPYACCVGLLALWDSGRPAVLPPNLQPGTLSRLETRTAGVLSDRAERRGAPGCIDPLDPDPGEARHAGPEEAAGHLGEIGRETPVLELFTSGSTGQEKRVHKRLRHLEDEVRCLEETWGAGLGTATVLSTASPHHLYGLLFGLLWPLVARRPFHAQQFLRPSELLPRARALGDCVLVGVPVHLRRLAQHRQLGDLAPHCRAIFSSGGPLAADTALRLARGTGRVPVEVLGSSETGGVAWRQQGPGAADAPWQPLAPVTVRRDPRTGRARVESPFVSVGDRERAFAMSDRIEPAGDGGAGRFVLAGRSDRTVKVGEKRLDLVAMESDLRRHDLVADAALVLAERGGETRVAAVLVLTASGDRRLRTGGRRALTRELAEHLAHDWDPVLVPRLWRMVAALPEDARGKTTAGALARLFEGEDPDAGTLATREDRPEVLERSRGAAFVEWRCRVPDALSCWPGHFPALPVVPAVLQIDWAMDLAAELLGRAPQVQEMSRVTFRDALGPGAPFRLRVEREGPDWLRFRLFEGDVEHASGRARIGPPDPR